MEEYGTIWVCLNCMLHHANGECGDCHEGHDEEPLSLVGEGSHVTMGLRSPQHDPTCDPDVRDCCCEVRSFDTSRCEGCGSDLHGERHAMAIWVYESRL